MNWNYRIFREENGDFVIREVFYNPDGSILGCTENAVEPWGRSVEDLAKQIKWFQEALQFPVLTLAEIPCKPPAPKRTEKKISQSQLMAELGLTEATSSSMTR